MKANMPSQSLIMGDHGFQPAYVVALSNLDGEYIVIVALRNIEQLEVGIVYLFDMALQRSLKYSHC
jgi:hypothetical protein